MNGIKNIFREINMTEKVAIVIPTFNRAKMVTKAIDTALAQTYPCQVIVCDHGSSDNTPEIIKKYGKKVTYIRKEKDRGITFCWLDGVINSDADYIHLHLDDDWMEPTFIEECMKYMQDDTVGMAFSDAYLYDIKNKKMYSNCLNVQAVFGTGVLPSQKLEKEILEHAFMLSPAACLYRKKDIIDALYPGDLPIDFGGSYKGVGPDHFMTLLCLLRYKKVACIGKSLVTFASHEGSITIDAQGNSEKAIKMSEAYNAVRKYYQLLKLYIENKGMLGKKQQNLKIKLFGIPLFKMVKKDKKIRWYFLGLPICIIKRDGND